MSQTGWADLFRARRDEASMGAEETGANRVDRDPFATRRRATLATVLVACVVTACSSGEAINPPVISPAEASSVDAEVVVEPTTPPTGVSSGASTTAISEPPAIPGLDSTNTFCRAWSRFSGSYTIVAPAWYVSAEPSYGVEVDAAGIEVAASQTMVAAYFEMGQSWPAEIEAQKEAGMASYDGLFQRSNRSLNRLKFFGATPEVLLELAQWWETQLPLWDGNQFPVIADAPPAAAKPLAEAAGATKQDEPSYADDLTLQSDPVPEVYEYLQQNCPDEGLLAGNEGVDG